MGVAYALKHFPVQESAQESLLMSELLGSLSHALDMTEGQPKGHCIRVCWIGFKIGESLGLPSQSLWELYYTLLLKDLGCSSNAARISQLYATDDLSFKRDYKLVDDQLHQVMHFVVKHTGAGEDLVSRCRKVLNVFSHGEQWAQDLMLTRCERGAEIARQLRLPENVAQGIRGLDEHWNGRGKPYGLAGEAIPLYSRIALLAQVADVFFIGFGQERAEQEINKRAGKWFDPQLVSHFNKVARQADFWRYLASPALPRYVIAMEPAKHRVPLTESYIDDIALAFGQVVDAKSPYTSGHCERVSFYAEQLANTLGLSHASAQLVRRGALLHDVGKLGVSNAILDKPGKLTDDEYEAIKLHARYTGEILSRIGPMQELAQVCQAHHERLDGFGYPHGLCDAEISLETRIITTADIFDAITAERPYRGAIPVPQALEMMREHLGTQIDQTCFAALEDLVERGMMT